MFYLQIFEISYSCAMGDDEYQGLQANARIFCSANEGCFVLILKYSLNNCGLENQVHVESIAVFQL